MKNILKSIIFYFIINIIFVEISKENPFIFTILASILLSYFYRKKGLTYNFFNDCKKNFSVKLIIPLILISFSIILFFRCFTCFSYHFTNSSIFLKNKDIVHNVNKDIFNIVIFSPTIEEFIFRYIIFRELIKKYDIYISLIISSTLFAIIHTGITGIFYALICGLILCIVFYTTKSILSSVIIHSTVNLMTCLEDLKIINIEFIYNFMINDSIYTIPPIIISILCIIFCLGHLNKYKIN